MKEKSTCGSKPLDMYTLPAYCYMLGILKCVQRKVRSISTPKVSRLQEVPSFQGHFCTRLYVTSSPGSLGGGENKSLVTTACTCANPYQQNMVSQFSQQNGLSRG